MIVGCLENKKILIEKFPALEAGFDFIIKNFSDFAFADIGEKKFFINDGIYAMSGFYFPKKSSEQKLEVHKKYADLHYIIKGADAIGWKSLSDCKNPYKKYDKKKDTAFLNEVPDFNIVLGEGKFALFFPQDAHSPLRGNGRVLKCILKIKTELF